MGQRDPIVSDDTPDSGRELPMGAGIASSRSCQLIVQIARFWAEVRHHGGRR
jgi:hypothetical protein